MDGESYEEILNALKEPPASKKRNNPRSVRLAAVTSALVDIVVAEAEDGSTNTNQVVSAAKVYANAVTALERTIDSNSSSAANVVSDSLATQVALLELLQLTLPHVEPVGILSATLPLTSRVLRAIAASCQSIGTTDSENSATSINNNNNNIDELGGVNAVLRWTCRTSTELIRRLDGKADNNTSNKNIIRQLFMTTHIALFHDRRPKVRKAAYNGALELLLAEDRRCNPAIIKSTTSFVHNELAAQVRRGDIDVSNHNVLHVLQFLERSITKLDYSKLGKDVMELLSMLMQVDSSSSSSSADFIVATKVHETTPKILTINTLLSTVLGLMSDTSFERKDALDEYSKRVLASLLQFKPSLVFRPGVADVEILQRGRMLFGQTVLAACQRVMVSDPDLSCKLLPLSVQMILLISRQPSDEIHDGIDDPVVQTLMVELTQLFRSQLPALVETKPHGLSACMADCLQNMEQIMQGVYRASWSVSLKTFVVLLQLGHTAEELPNYIESIVRLRNQVPAGSSEQHAVEDAISSLIQGVGIEVFWKAVNWQPAKQSLREVSDGICIDRAWILSTMRTAAMTAQPQSPNLSFFQKDVLGMARICDKLAHSTSSNATRNIQKLRVIEIWALFPCFCIGPADLPLVMPTLSTTLSRAMEDKRYPQLVTSICTGLTALVNSIQENNTSAADTETISEVAVKILPTAFKIISESRPSSSNKINSDSMDVETKPATSVSVSGSDVAQQLQSITEAISSLARVAPPSFLQNLFKKLMHRILEEVQKETSDPERICSLLNLSQALVASGALDEASVSFLYRALKPLIRNDEKGPRVQKRAYKVLAEICERHHSYIAEIGRLKELTDLLVSTIMTSQVAARHMRLKCLGIIVKGFDEANEEMMTEIFKLVPEVLLCLKDSNGKTREAAYQLLISIASNGDISKFLAVTTAALGAETTHMRSAAIMALSRIVFEFAREDTDVQAQLPSLLRTVLIIIDENSREVIKSVIGFIRVSVAAIPREQLEPVLPELVGGLLKYHKVKDRFRSKIKIILKKLVKLYGYDSLMPHVPESETRLLTHMRKLDERQARKKASGRSDERQGSDEFDDMIDSDEEDSDDGRTLMTGVTGFTKLTGRSTKHGGKSTTSKAGRSFANNSVLTSKSNRRPEPVLPDETDGEIIDMLGSNIAKRVRFTASEVDDNDSDSGVMEFNDDGRLVVPDDLDPLPNQKVSDDEEEPALRYNKKRRRLNSKPDTKGGKKQGTRSLGASYKSKKAGGDVKKKGQKYEPYAFVPLDGRSYSKKNRRSAVEQMGSVVRSGKRKRS